jgi:hypothetical protein
MGSTSKGFSFPAYSDPPDIPADIQLLAQNIDTYLTANPGAQGSVGTQGSQGIVGPQGVQGTQGIQGATGTQGTQGTIGAQGTVGAQGIQGTQGVQGVQGSVGAQGVQGTEGIQGATGTQGSLGTQGTAGTGVNILGTYATLGALQSAHPTGTLGDGYLIGLNLFVWTGSEWTDSGPVQGPQGTTGAQGTVGSQGTVGLQGAVGTQGAIGTQGATGAQGTDGAQGTVGLQGTVGSQGAVGTQGAIGTQGATGAQGTDGAQGTTGTQGTVGTQGTLGSTGTIQTNSAVVGLIETANVVAAATTSTINMDVSTSTIWYYTTGSTSAFTLNVRGNSGTTLNSLLSTGQSITVAFLNTTGASTASYPSTFQIDGSTQGSIKWLNGTAPTVGNASSIDSYIYTILKTASATYTVFGSQTKYA